jgi:hypothetical protein
VVVRTDNPLIWPISALSFRATRHIREQKRMLEAEYHLLHSAFFTGLLIHLLQLHIRYFILVHET